MNLIFWYNIKALHLPYFYSDLESLRLSTYIKKHFYLNFVLGLFFLTYEKKNSYNFIFIIVDYLIKIVYFDKIKIIINALELLKIIIDIIIYYNIFYY